MKQISIPIPEGIDKKIKFELSYNTYTINDVERPHHFSKCLCDIKGYSWYNLKHHILIALFYEDDII